MTIQNYRFSIQATTGEDGTAAVQVKVPGQFSGASPSSNGRFFSGALIWSKNPIDEDRVTHITVQDLDGILASASGNFPNYPVIGSTLDPDLTYNEQVLSFVFLNPNRPIEIGPSDPNTPTFIPSGMYLCATFVAGDAALGRTFYGNFLWTKLL